MAINVAFDSQQMARAMDLMNPSKIRSAQHSAIKKTINSGRTMIRREVQKVLNVKTEFMLGTKKAKQSRIIQATMVSKKPPIGKLTVTRAPIPLVNFKGVRVTKRKGVNVKIIKQKPPVKFRHAFKAPINNTPHIVTRAKGGRIGRMFDKLLKLGGRTGWYDKDGYVKRTPTNTAYGPNVYTVLKAGEMQRRVYEELGKLLLKNFEGQFSRKGFLREVAE